MQKPDETLTCDCRVSKVRGPCRRELWPEPERLVAVGGGAQLVDARRVGGERHADVPALHVLFVQRAPVSRPLAPVAVTAVAAAVARGGLRVHQGDVSLPVRPLPVAEAVERLICKGAGGGTARVSPILAHRTGSLNCR